jgi:ligand-binding sensor domain-containing protein
MPGQICAAVWEGRRYAATVAGLNVWEGGRWWALGLPSSSGTHISALLPHGDRLWAALYGDGIRAYNGKGWLPVDVGLPAQAREITALAAAKTALWVGTRRAGLWERRDDRWQQHLQADEPVDHNCQAIIAYRDDLYISTLEDGLAVRTPQGWGHVQAPPLSSDAPRQMVVFRDRLYVRHGDGRVDEYDGRQWQRYVCAHLPRRQASVLATDGERLYVAQWGGWSEFDGRDRIYAPEDQALCRVEGGLWIGTRTGLYFRRD